MKQQKLASITLGSSLTPASLLGAGATDFVRRLSFLVSFPCMGMPISKHSFAADEVDQAPTDP